MSSRLRIWATLFVVEPARALLRHTMRSALSVLGIMIGVAAAVLVVAIGRAGSDRAEAVLHNLGDNLVWVEAGSRNVNGVRSGTHGTQSLTLEDAEAIQREIPLIKSVSPQVDGTAQVLHGDRNWSTRYRGVSPEYLEIKRFELASGAAFSEDDVLHIENVCLLGQTVRERLFGPADPVGEVIQVGTKLFTVVGLLAPKGQSATGQDQDDTILVPYTTAMRKLRGGGMRWLDDILCSGTSPQAVDVAVGQITALMRQRHQIAPGEDDDFNMRRPDVVIKAQIEASNALALLLTSVASIALLVGGIGIMNVMLASVAQRTAEIGLRLAVGAKRRAIRMQFLGEAVILTVFGGLTGVVLSVAGSFIVGWILEWPIAIPLQALLLALVSSVSVGVFFGFYPASKAARLDPIVALRHE
ncbi:MAG TPA: ABC transporter permease [Polyangiaceae bacterium]